MSLQTPLPKVMEFPVGKAGLAHVEVFVKLPRMDARTRRAVSTAAFLVVNPLDAPAVKIGEGGPPLRFSESSDFLRFSLATPSQRLKSSLRTLSELLSAPTFPNEVGFANAPGSAITGARQFATGTSFLSNAQLRETWRYAVNSSTVTIGISGAFNSGEMQTEWEGLRVEWPAAPNFPPNVNTVSVAPDSAPTEDVLTFSMSPALLSNADLAKVLVATAALGGGKESLGWKVLREDTASSYQFGALLKRQDGWWVCEFSATLASADLKPKVQEMLLAEVEKLSENTLAAAKGCVKGQLIVGVSPLSIDGIGTGNIVTNVADRLYLRTALMATSGFDWNEYTLYNEVRQVSLEDLKAMLKQWIAGD